MKKIIKVNKHTADVICCLLTQEFLNEKEIQNRKINEIRKFLDTEKATTLCTKTYIYLFVPKIKTN